MSNEIRLLMIGAMYENGGNTAHRFLDGHPQLFVYPFESQVGTALVKDQLSSTFPAKYRWPTFALHATPEQDYGAIIDEEAKVRARTPNVSKFREWPMELDDDERREIYLKLIAETGRSRPDNMAAFFRSTFEAWKDHEGSGREEAYVGYSPIIVVDADKILDDLPNAHFLHIVRNPWSAYADTKKRPVPLSLSDYMLGWTLNQHFALLFRQLYPDRLHIVRTEDVLEDSRSALGGVCEAIGLERAESLEAVSWNGRTLDQVHPWGTIRVPDTETNLATARELSSEEKEQVAVRAGPFLEPFGYRDFPA